MAGKITLWGSEQWMKTIFGRSVLPVDVYYLALVKNTAPSIFISGSELDEPTDNYTRYEIPNTNDYWTDPGAKRSMQLAQDLTINVAGEWGLITYWALCNAAVGGYLYVVGKFDASIDTVEGDQIIVAEGDLQLGISSSTGDF